MNQILYKNTKISYSDTGKGNAVVLLHGFLENQTMWQDLVLKNGESFNFMRNIWIEIQKIESLMHSIHTISYP